MDIMQNKNNDKNFNFKKDLHRRYNEMIDDVFDFLVEADVFDNLMSENYNHELLNEENIRQNVQSCIHRILMDICDELQEYPQRIYDVRGYLATLNEQERIQQCKEIDENILANAR